MNSCVSKLISFPQLRVLKRHSLFIESYTKKNKKRRENKFKEDEALRLSEDELNKLLEQAEKSHNAEMDFYDEDCLDYSQLETDDN